MAKEQDQNLNSQTSDELDEFSDLMGMDEEPTNVDQDGNQDQDANQDADADAGDGQVQGSTEVDVNTDDKQNASEGAFEEGSKEYWENRARLMEEQLAAAYKKTPASEAKTEEETPIEGSSFFGEWKFEDIIENEESFKKFLGDFATKVKTVTKESILKDLPGTVTKLTAEQIETRRIVTDFYEDNKELQSVKPFVAQITNQVASEHPDWSLSDVLAETAVRSYKALGLRKKIDEANEGKQKKPAFVNQARGRRGEVNPQKTKLEKELEELMEL